MVSSTQPILPSRGLSRVLMWPFVMVWRLCWGLTTMTVNATGILLGLVLGFVAMALGLFLCSTIVGFPIGLPLAIIGFFVLLRALY